MPDSAISTPPEGPPGKGRGPATAVVRHGLMGFIGEFTVPKSVEFASGAKLVVQTERGVEIGEHVLYTSHGCSGCAGCGLTIPRERMRQYAGTSGAEFMKARAGRVLREATDDDLHDKQHIVAQRRVKIGICARLIEQHGLRMKLVNCEHLFGGERIVFYFMAEGRVDFRALVRDLAAEFQTRIEMRQVGARDEARLLADYETCGRECCCRNFLKTLKPVSMRMAKMQKATLDPSKVSGRCGRLKCCLRYEHETYEDLDKRLPRVGDRVTSERGEGIVTGRQVITQLLTVAGTEGQRYPLAYEDVIRHGEKELRPPDEKVAPVADPWETADVFDLTQVKPKTAPPEEPADTEKRPAEPTNGTAETREKPRRKSRRRRRRRPRGRRGGGSGGGATSA